MGGGKDPPIALGGAGASKQQLNPDPHLGPLENIIFGILSLTAIPP